MLEPLLGSLNAERCLLFIFAREEGYASEMAKLFQTDLFGIQRQLEKLEAGGVLESHKVGRTRTYRFNREYPFLIELRALLAKAFRAYPPGERDRLRATTTQPPPFKHPHQIPGPLEISGSRTGRLPWSCGRDASTGSA